MTEVSRTLSEIRATATKAVRGYGCDWGMAEEAGFAVRVLESHDLPGVRVVAQLLAEARDCTTCRHGLTICGLAAMTALSDRLPSVEDGVPVGPVDSPLLLAAPLITYAQAHGLTYRLAWDTGAVVCGPSGVVAEGTLDAPIAASITLEQLQDDLTQSRGPTWRSRSVAAQDWEHLEALAARTLVPETETSRALGAGANG